MLTKRNQIGSQHVYVFLINGGIKTWQELNPLTAKPLFKKSLFHQCKFQFWNAIYWWLTQADWQIYFSIPFCRNYLLSKVSRVFFMFLPVEGATKCWIYLSVSKHVNKTISIFFPFLPHPTVHTILNNIYWLRFRSDIHILYKYTTLFKVKNVYLKLSLVGEPYSERDVHVLPYLLD